MKVILCFCFLICLSGHSAEQKQISSTQTECPSFDEGVYECRADGKVDGVLRVNRGLLEDSIAYSFQLNTEAPHILKCVDFRSEIFLCDQRHRNRSELDSNYCKKEFSNLEIRKVEVNNVSKTHMTFYKSISQREMNSLQPYKVVEEAEFKYSFSTENKITFQISKLSMVGQISKSNLVKTFVCLKLPSEGAP